VRRTVEVYRIGKTGAEDNAHTNACYSHCLPTIGPDLISDHVFPSNGVGGGNTAEQPRAMWEEKFAPNLIDPYLGFCCLVLRGYALSGRQNTQADRSRYLIQPDHTPPSKTLKSMVVGLG